MPRPISFRPDEESARALARLQATGLTTSEAIRAALLDAERALDRRDALASEVTALEADETDRREMAAVAALMEQLRASG